MIGPLAYVGGKRRLAPTILRLLPPHVTYVEPFAGGAQVFFHKPPSRVEVLNDVDGEIVNFLRVCREHPDELTRIVRYLVPSRSVFAQFASQEPSQLTDIQRAARFLYLQKNAFGGLIIRRTYHYSVTKPATFNPARVTDLIARASRRLQRVQVEHLPYADVLARYDRPTTVFYLDPPYIGLDLYRYNLPNDQYAVLASQLSQIRGKFLLSINDCPLSRRLFSGFHMRPVRVAYTVHRSVPTVRELLFSNTPFIDPAYPEDRIPPSR